MTCRDNAFIVLGDGEKAYVGDKVICTASKGLPLGGREFLVEGNEYKISAISPDPGGSIRLAGSDTWFSESRFRLSGKPELSERAIMPLTPLKKQEGGQHYKQLAIQPIEYGQKNHLGACEYSVVKYVTRHKDKGKAEDVKKALHFCQLLLEIEYGIKSTVEYDEPENPKV